MNPSLTLAVAGIGGRMRSVLKHLLSALDRPVVLRVFDPDASAVTLAASELKAEVVSFPSWEEALNGEGVEWALVGSFNSAHRENVVAAFGAGKHVFCEKPLAIKFEDCVAMREAHLKSGKMFFFGLVLRYASIYQTIFDVSRPSEIGKLISFEFNETLRPDHGGYIHGNWRRYVEHAGPHLLEKCCHDIDLAHWMTGSIPVKAASFGGLNFFTPEHRPFAESLGTNEKGKNLYETWVDPYRVDPFDGKQEIIDNQVVILEYANGARATFHTNCNAAIQERRFYILGAKGAVRGDSATGEVERRMIGFGTTSEKIPVDVKDDHAGGDAVMAQHLAESILCGKTPLAGMEEAVISAITCFGIDKAMNENTIVDLRPLWERAGVPLR